MSFIPPFILRRLYVKGSLTNVESGFQFTLTNSLGDATLVKPLSLAVDEQPLDPARVKLLSEGKVIPNSEISETNPVDFRVNSSATIVVEGLRLQPGEHRIVISSSARGYGDIRFEIKDVVK
ncbi:MAG: hypothetical protein QXX81_00915 [Zestosphaera sp.]